MSADEYDELKTDIETNGYDDSRPIYIYNGGIIDGWNRYRACQELGVTPAIKAFQGDDTDAIQYVLSSNKRRNLTSSQRAAIAVEADEIIEAIEKAVEEERRKKISKRENVGNRHTSTMLEMGQLIAPSPERDNKEKEAAKSRTKIAETFGTNRQYISDAKRIKEQDPDSFERIKRGETTITKVKKEKRRKDDGYLKRLNQPSGSISPIEAIRVCKYGDNMYRKSSTRSEERYGDKVFSLSDEKYNTVSTLSRFYHRETMIEFSLREYAQVQTFPDSYKFVGTYSTIKKQIGNAVAPEMGKYITAHLQGRTVGDLFAGCGGFSCGAHKNGLQTKWAIEWEEDAALSFKFNNPDTDVYNSNIKDINPSNLGTVDVIIGGPPCQGFSSANHENKKVSGADRFIDDERNLLYKEFVRFVKVLKPAEFIMENVQEIYEVKHQIIADFEELGYSVDVTLVAGNEIGMKQNRKRCFFIGNKTNN